MVKKRASKQHKMEAEEDTPKDYLSLDVPAKAKPAKAKAPPAALKVSSEGVSRPKAKGSARGQKLRQQKLRKNSRLQKALSVSDKKGQRLSKASATQHRKQQLKHLWTTERPQPELGQ